MRRGVFFDRDRLGPEPPIPMKPSNALLPMVVLSVIGLPGAGVLFGTEPLPPTAVTGKEYSGSVFPPVPLPPTPSILWDGLGNEMGLGGDFHDAMAHRRDAHFHDVAYRNAAALLVSFWGPTDDGALISYESPDGSRGPWARPEQISRFPTDVDALEVGGPEWVSNTDFYSSFSDQGGTFAIHTRSGYPVLPSDELAWALGLVPGAGTINGVALSDAEIDGLARAINLDALMYHRNQADDSAISRDPRLPVPPDLPFAGDEILFSIEPLRLPGGGFLFDGGEIWTYTINGDDPAQFLDHGGHLWNTEFDVRGTFGVFSENVDALEAVALTPVPEAGTVAASGLLAAMVAMRILRRRCWSGSGLPFERQPAAREEAAATSAWTP